MASGLYNALYSPTGDIVTPAVQYVPLPVTAAALAIVPATHAGKVLVLNRAAGIAITLPNATGTGNYYMFFVLTTITSNTTTFTRGTAADAMGGQAFISKSATATSSFTAAANSNTITLDGTTRGGTYGDWIELMDLALNQWWVDLTLSGSGTLATPFSNT
jgi:hypothetical protein